jgi:putative membrane-bound dehydrogenase-like protein
VRAFRLFGAALLALGASAAEPSAIPQLPRIPPKSPDEAAKTFRVLDGFRMELLAAEPFVASPVAMTYDENGRAFVCEMRDYPYTDKAHHKPGQENPTDAPIGRIRLLEDTDGDGVFDKSTIFAEGLSWPTGVACWKGGIFVATTPDIWYLKDTDGDGVADVRRKVFTGFRKLNVQAVMNNLVWGVDNRIHGAGGSNGGEIRTLAAPVAKPAVLSHSDFAFDPVTEAFELLSGGARFGGSFDDWGHRFLCNIRNPAQHIVLPARYLARNPYLAARSPLNDMAESGDQLPVHRISEPEPWRVLRAKRWSGERDIVMPRSELVGAGVVTSASGVTSYRGAAYPESYRGNVFVCECAGNLLYRLKLTPDGPTFKATRVDGDREMVASTDNWFRPVNFINAPDGTLHVLDMYRENIEHPWSIPEDIHAAVDLEAGRDMGRIWRLAPPEFKPPGPPKLGIASIGELVATVENPNSWWRETAQRLLFERQDKSAAPALRELMRQGRTPQGRLQACWTLDGLRELTSDDVLVALRDTNAGIRENALKLAEARLKDSAELRDSVVALAADADAGVRLQAAFTLGEMDDARALDAIHAIAKRDNADPWIRTAVLSSTAGTSDQLLVQLLGDPAFGDATELIRDLAQIVGARGRPVEMSRAIVAAEHRGGVFQQVMASLGEGLKRSGRSLRKAGLDDAAASAVSRALAEAARVATDGKMPMDTRVAAIQLLANDEFDGVVRSLASLLDGQEAQEVQRAAVTAIGSFNRPETASLLLSHWNACTPAIRAEIVLTMLASRVRTLPLLEAIEHGDLPANQVPFARRALLLRSTDAKVKELATRLFGDASASSRKEVIEKYQPALAMNGDAARGRKVFEATCSACHRRGEMGNDVGPNLATIRQWSPEQLLLNILDPNREVAPNFINYLVETKDGRTLDGMIVEESAASLTLKRAGGVQETVLRRDIAQISGSKLSLMPEGLEAAINVEQMADLIAFLLDGVK